MNTIAKAVFARARDTRARGALVRAAVMVLATGPAVRQAGAANFQTWTAGSGTWVDGTGASNWTPAIEPGPSDFATIGSAVTVTMGSANSIAGLNVYNSGQLVTNGFNLSISSNTTFNGGVSGMTVSAGSAVSTNDIIIGTGSGGQLTMNGGTLTCVDPTSNYGQIVNLSGTVKGYGTINVTEAPASTVTVFENDGTLTATSNFGILFGAPPAGTLTIHAISTNAVIDLDGTGSELGVVNVERNQTLLLNGNTSLADAFSGTMNLYHNGTFHIDRPWSMDGGHLNADTGATGVFPFNTPADVAHIAGGAFTQTNGVITVTDTDGTLQFDAPFTMTGGQLVNNGKVVFNANATIYGDDFKMPTGSSSITVSPGVAVTTYQANFNVDGSDTANNVLTIGSGASLTLNLGLGGDETVSGTTVLSGGTLTEYNLDTSWAVNGALSTTANSGTSTLAGDALGLTNGSFTVASGSTLLISTSSVIFTTGGTVSINSGGTLLVPTTATFAGPSSVTGAGTLILEGAASVSSATIINMTGGTVDIDGRDTDLVGNTVTVYAPFTINAAVVNSFGKTNTSGTNVLTVDHLNGGRTGTLAVNLDSAGSEWTLNPKGVLNLLNSNSALTLLAGSPLNVNGTINVTGDVRSTARLDVGATGVVNVNTSGVPFRLGGGTLANPNTIAGGTINGPGVLGADANAALVGYGTVNPNIAFTGAAELRAKGGTLTLNGTISDVGIVGTADGTGTLHLTNVQSLDATMTMELLGGGTVEGAAINNDGLIRGNGTVANSIVNNHASGVLRGVAGGTLKFTGAVGLSSGTIDLNSGTVEFTQSLSNAAGTGHINGPGTLRADANLSNSGAMSLPAGTTNVFGDVSNASGATIAIGAGGANANFNGNVTLSSGASLTAAAGSVNYFLANLNVSGTVTLAANVTGTSIHALTINAGGSFDTNNDKLIIDYSGASPIDTIRSYIQSGRLFSSTAAADAQHRMTIGYAEASSLGVSTWSTLPVDTTAVLTKVTWYGDANLDGVVNADDYALIDRGFAKGLTGWSNGDFDHSGAINSADYLLIDRVYFQQGAALTPEFLSLRESQFGADYVSALVAAVPEPGAVVAVIGLAVVPMIRRRSK